MSFTPFDSKKQTPRPPADPQREAVEYAGGEMAAHAIIQSFRGPSDWLNFYRTFTGPSHYAERIFPPNLWTDAARRGFVWFFLEVERAKRMTGEWRIQ